MRKMTITAVALMLLAGAAFAQPPMDGKSPDGMPPGHPKMMGMMGHGGMDMKGCDNDGPGAMKGCMRSINLSDDQEAKLEKIHFTHQRKQIERKATMVDMQSKLKLAMTAEKFNQKDIDELAAKIGKFHQEAVLLKVSNLREVREILTPEQRPEFDQNVLNMGPGMGMGMGMGDGKGRGMGKGMGKCGPGGCGEGMGRGKMCD